MSAVAGVGEVFRSPNINKGGWGNKGESAWSAFNRGVENYNQQIMDAEGSRSLIQKYEEQIRLLRRIEENTKQQGEGVPNVL